jgi:predicted nucleic acid-binding protein
MIRLLIDTNIVLDLLAKREEFYTEAAQLFSLADVGFLTLTTSSLTFANTHYILSKIRSKSEAKEVIRKFKVLIETLALNDKILDLALNEDDFSDFEDAIQYYTAIENKIDIIITRNIKDFKNSSIPAMTAKEFLLRPEFKTTRKI